MDDTPVHSDSRIRVVAEDYFNILHAKGFSPRTIQIYRQALHDFDHFVRGLGVRVVQNVTTAHVEAYRRHLQQRGFSPAGEETYARSVKRFFDEMERRQRVFENPFAGTGPVRRARKQIPVPTEAEIASLMAVPDVSTARGLRTRAVLEVAYSTGMRLEELARMELGDIDVKAGTVRVMGKGRRERVVPLGRSAADWVRRYIAEVRDGRAAPETTRLWVRPDGKPLGSLAIGLSVREAARQAGTETHITPHGLRRACATHMLAHGAHPVQIQMLLGHASLSHLSAYLRVRFRDLKAMHERSRLGQ